MRMLRLGDIGGGTIVDENPLRDSARGTNSTTGGIVPRCCMSSEHFGPSSGDFREHLAHRVLKVQAAIARYALSGETKI